MRSAHLFLQAPLPFSYALHLKSTTYIYLCLLPFQAISTLGYLTIPATATAAWVFLGFLKIGDMIEQPVRALFTAV